LVVAFPFVPVGDDVLPNGATVLTKETEEGSVQKSKMASEFISIVVIEP